MEDWKGDIMVRNTPPSLPPSLALPFIPRGRDGGEEEGKRREEERRMEEGEEEETYV